MTRTSPYGWLMLAGILVSIGLWSRIARRDSRLIIIYVAALAGAFVGAKIVYLASEGWLHWNDPNRWLILATGKSITGALLGGYAAVEIAKRFVGYTQPTGDWFAIIAPIGIILGRIGCVLHGCCLGRPCVASWFTVTDANGIPRWPAAQAELAFNALALVAMLLLRSIHPSSAQSTASNPKAAPGYLFAGQHFHLYLIAYGLFRFFHEHWRETPQILGPFSGYQIASLGLVLLGALGFRARQRATSPPSVT